jgi:hypothetical protein
VGTNEDDEPVGIAVGDDVDDLVGFVVALVGFVVGDAMGVLL